MRTLASLLLLLALPASADPLFYRITDADSSVWLLGSVHALRGGDYPLDDRIENAYREAEHVVLEVDPAELDPAHLATVALPLARYADGSQLADAFSDAEYALLRRHFASLGLDIAQFREFEPWFVALQLFAFELARNGYAGAQGVDAHFAARAVKDAKTTGGLETAAEQFGMFDALPGVAQKQFLLDAVKESGNFRHEMESIVNAWRNGDEAALLAMLEKEFGNTPALRDTLLDARNRRWVDGVETLLAQPGDALVVVGALHLVGEEGLVNLLEAAGHDVEKL